MDVSLGLGREAAAAAIAAADPERSHIIHCWRDRYGWHSSSTFRHLSERTDGRGASITLVEQVMQRVKFHQDMADVLRRWCADGALQELAIILTLEGPDGRS